MAGAHLDDFLGEVQQEIEELLNLFSDYEPVRGFDKAHLIRWLQQFQAQHRRLALKLAQSIHYYGIDKINSLMPKLHAIVEQQIAQEACDPKSVFYVPFGRTGDSGEDIVRRYRNVNKLHSLQNQFINVIELPKRVFEVENPVVVFLDDFVGTGKQVTDYWKEELFQYVAEYIPMYLAVIAACKAGASRIEG